MKLIVYSLILTLSYSCFSDADQIENLATSTIHSQRGSNAEGKVLIREKNGKLEIQFMVNNLSPHSIHGIHIHENGTCEGTNAEKAGGHFNPMGLEHGSLAEASTHAGDLGNLESNSEGQINEFVETDKINLNPDSKANIIDKTIIIHAKADDFTSQPSGMSGKRIACGVIKSTKAI